MNLSESNVVIIGGFGGIGQAICKALLEERIVNLAVLDLKEDAVLKTWQAAYPKQTIFYVPIDVTSENLVVDAIKTVMDKIHNIDVLINCSGIVNDTNAELTIQVNLLGVIYTTLTAMSCMGKHKGGKGGLIVTVASNLGLRPCNIYAIYAASKHGVIGFTRSMADDFHFDKTGIRFLIMCPGATDTNLTQNLRFTTVDYAEELLKEFQAKQSQTATICGENIVKIMKTDKNNGSIWILKLGEIKEIHLPDNYD